MKNLHAQMGRKVTHMRSNWLQKWSQNRQKTQLEQKRATSIPIAICYTLTTFGFPRTTQKPSRIVNENTQTNNITFPVRQMTNDTKRRPFGLHFSSILMSFWSFGPGGAQYLPKVTKRTSNKGPEGATSCPAEAKRAPQ